MAARTSTTAEPTMQKYVVLVDAVNVTTGKKPSGGSAVTRLLRGSVITALPNDTRIVDLLSMNSIAEVETVAETAKALAKQGNAKAPTVLNKDHAGYRVTGRGVALALGAADDPALPPVEEVQPLDAAHLDTTPTVTE